MLLSIIVATLIGVSFATVHPRMYALTYNDITKQISFAVEGSGRHFIGLGKSYVPFQRGFISYRFATNPGSEGCRCKGGSGKGDTCTLEDHEQLWCYVSSDSKCEDHEDSDDGGRWSEQPCAAGAPDDSPVTCITKTGELVQLHISLQIQLTPEKIPYIYLYYGNGIRDYFRLLMKETILDVASQYPTQMFFTDRTLIKERLEQALATTLLETAQNYAALRLVQLREVALPSKFETAILTKMKKKQESIRAPFSQQVDTLRKEVEMVARRAEGDVLYVMTNATAEGQRRIDVAEAIGQAKVHVSEGREYAKLVEQLALSGMGPEAAVEARRLAGVEEVESENAAVLAFYLYHRLAMRQEDYVEADECATTGEIIAGASPCAARSQSRHVSTTIMGAPDAMVNL